MHRAIVHLFADDSKHVSTCIACNAEGTHACAKCGIRYCGAACQHADWHQGQHKKICDALVGGRAKEDLIRKLQERRARRDFIRAIKRETIVDIYQSTFNIMTPEQRKEITTGIVNYLTDQQLIQYAVLNKNAWPFFARFNEFWYMALERVFPSDVLTGTPYKGDIDYHKAFYNNVMKKKIKRGQETLGRYGDLILASTYDDDFEEAVKTFAAQLNPEDVLGGLQQSDPMLWNWLSTKNVFWFYYYILHFQWGTMSVKPFWSSERTRSIDWRKATLGKYKML